MFYDTDSTEAMKSHMSDLVLGKQEQIAYINQLERGLEENKLKETLILMRLIKLRMSLFLTKPLKRKRNIHNKF